MITGLCGGAAAWAADLEVVLSGVRSGDGPLNVALYVGSDRFGDGEGRADGLSLKAEGETVRGVFKNVTPGWVSVLVHHDENQNEKFDRFLGVIPLEGYGMSGTSTLSGPPTWESTRFLVPEAGMTLNITLSYPTSPPP